MENAEVVIKEQGQEQQLRWNGRILGRVYTDPLWNLLKKSTKDNKDTNRMCFILISL